MDNTSAKEQLLRTASLETSSLRQEIDSVVRTKENVVLENRRVQDELASCAAYCRSTQNELEAAKRQIDDLKRQLQHYVAEVKRFEDMMSKKEMERAEILDQFKSLSQEANDLEHNNHTLENEATQSKVQLSVTLDHVADLEHNLTTQADMINSYEKKIKDLSSQIAETNLQLNRHKQQHDRCEADLNSLRDLCMRLDKQKETLIQDLQSKDEHRSNVDKDVTRLRCECETLQACLSKDRITIENLERLLSESRQESVRQKILNDDLDVELRRLKQKVEELQKVSPTTATFTYSANIGQPTSDKYVCPCCKQCPAHGEFNNEDQGDIIDTSSAVVTPTSECRCCTACIGSKIRNSLENINVQKNWKKNCKVSCGKRVARDVTLHGFDIPSEVENNTDDCVDAARPRRSSLHQKYEEMKNNYDSGSQKLAKRYYKPEVQDGGCSKTTEISTSHLQSKFVNRVPVQSAYVAQYSLFKSGDGTNVNSAVVEK